MVKSITLLLGQFYLIILVLNIVLTSLAYRQLPREVRTIVYFLLVSMVVDLISRWLFYQSINNLFLLHIYTLLEWLTWSYFFLTIYRSHQWISGRWPVFVVVGVTILLILNTLLLEPVSGFNSNAKSLIQVLIIAYSTIYLFRSFGKLDLRNPVYQAINFIIFAAILYYSGSLFIFMGSKMLNNLGVAANDQFGLWAINALLLVVLHGLIFIALCKLTFRKVSSS